MKTNKNNTAKWLIVTSLLVLSITLQSSGLFGLGSLVGGVAGAAMLM